MSDICFPIGNRDFMVNTLQQTTEIRAEMGKENPWRRQTMYFPAELDRSEDIIC